ncbi:hypothetical protein [Xanthomonas phage BUDD]|nr:hypothetical protein [Xanthomonas phage BUDD]
MSKMRILGGKDFYGNLEGDETIVRHILVSLNARKRKAILKNRKSRYRFIRELQASGIVERGGCQCSHCMNDWDCCGRWFMSHAKIIPAPKGVFIAKTYQRNI